MLSEHRACWLPSRAPRTLVLLGLVAIIGFGTPALGQAPLAGGLPGAWIEGNAFAQQVTNAFGDWRGGYVRAVRPSPTNTWYGEVLGLQAFNERGVQVGGAHRHEWNSRVFHIVGVNVGDGAPILPRLRTDGTVGVRLGSRRQWQVASGASYVKSVTELYDVAATGSIAWYAPKALLLEVAGRYNISQPGDIRSHRLLGVAVFTPSPKRSISLRTVGGSEGWQIISAGTTLQRFHSTEYALAWREKVTTRWAISVQGDRYDNPFYTRAGVTIGVARYW